MYENWLEDLRYSYNLLYGGPTREGQSPCAPQAAHTGDSPWVSAEAEARAEKSAEAEEEPIVINSGFRSEAVNEAVGGVDGSNHLTGCAVDIRCYGIEQAIRYASILLDIADGTKRDFDELLIERSPKGVYWIHFAVRPKDNRRKTRFIQT